MGKINVFDITLSNKKGVYFAGQVLQGHVIIELNEPVKLKGIKITYRGRAFVHWTEQLMRGPGESRFREIRHHSATEEYFDISHSLIPRGSGHHEDKKILAPGQYTYPFQFELPSNLPSSFEGQYGFLRYWVKVTIEKAWKNDYSTKKVYTVICPMDLNREPSSGKPLQSKKHKRLCCLCCRSGPVSALLGVQQKGYVPGEAIIITGEVNNMSSRKMGGSSVELKMTTVFHSTTKTRAVTQQVAKLKRGPISVGDTDIWEGEKLVIPPLPPTFLLGCSIIDIKYIIELRVDPVGPAFDLSVPINILIGTIPVRSAVHKYIRNNQISPPPDRVLPSLPSLNIGRSNSPLGFMHGPHSPSSPGHSLSQPSSPGSVFSYGQPSGPAFPPGYNHLNPQRQFQGQGQGYGHTSGPGYGYSQHSPQGQSQGQSHSLYPGQGAGGYNQLNHQGHFQRQGFGQTLSQVHGHSQGQSYGQAQDYRYGQTQDSSYGQPQGQGSGQPQGHGYGQTQGKSYGQTQGNNYGQPYGINQGYPHGRLLQNLPGQASGRMYPQLQDTRQYNGAGNDYTRGASPDVLANSEWMPTPIFDEYFFGQRYVRDDDDDEENTRGDMYYTPLYVYYEFEKQQKESKPTRTVRIAS